MSFTHEPSTDRGKCRLLVYDTDSSSYIFEDDEIDAMLELNSDSVLYATADLCRSAAAKNASNAILLDIAGSLKIDRKQVSKVWMLLAARYEARASGSSAQLREFIDSYDIEIDDVGIDMSEYVGDI